MFQFQGPLSSLLFNPVVITNVFSQTLPGSIAEVIVCWSVIGISLESVLKSRFGNIISIVLCISISTILFGAYFAHSSPFNQINTVLFLMMPGLLTSIFYFIGRNIYATIIFITFKHYMV